MSEEPQQPGFFAALRKRVVTPSTDSTVPNGLQIAAAYAWRMLLIGAVAAGFVWLIIQLKLIVVPLLVALLVSALLYPAFSFMLRHRFPRWLAIVISVVGTVSVVTGLLWLAIWQITQQASSVQKKTMESIEGLQQWLMDGPLQLSQAQIDEYLSKGQEVLSEQMDLLLNGALQVGTTLAHVLTGALLAIFILLTLLADGNGIWKWTVGLFPRQARAAIDASARMGWKTVVNYARTQMLVASIDAVGIGLGAFLLGVPLAVPIGVLVFLGSFIPIVGAVVTGFIAVFLALVYNGLPIAIVMLIVVLGVQQVEGHILQPLMMGAAVKVHPLAVVLVVAGGAMVAGIPGALFAVPLAAFVNVVAVSLSSGSWRSGATIRPEQLIWRTEPRERRAR